MIPADLLTANLGVSMTRSLLRTALAALIPAALATSHASGQEPAPSAEAVRFFEARIRPVLADQCFKCHGPEKQKAGLRLDSRSAMLGGGDSGPAVVPGQPEESLLVEALRYEADGLQMPPSKKLPDEQVDDLLAMGPDGCALAGRGHGRRRPPPRASPGTRSPTRTATTGPSGPSRGPRSRRSGTGNGAPTRSIASCWRSSRRRA